MDTRMKTKKLGKRAAVLSNQDEDKPFEEQKATSHTEDSLDADMNNSESDVCMNRRNDKTMYYDHLSSDVDPEALDESIEALDRSMHYQDADESRDWKASQDDDDKMESHDLDFHHSELTFDDDEQSSRDTKHQASDSANNLSEQPMQNKAPPHLPSISTKTAKNKKELRSSEEQEYEVEASNQFNFTWEDVLKVQNLIERCLQQYLTKSEVLMTLKVQAQIEPEFASIVWHKLEEQNPAFFRAYYMQLQLKEQVIAFNYLIGRQKDALAGNDRVLQLLGGGAASIGDDALPSFGIPALSPDGSLPAFMQAGQEVAKSSMTKSGKKRSKGRASKKGKQREGASSIQATTSDGFDFGELHGDSGDPPLDLLSPIKTELDTHAFFT